MDYLQKEVRIPGFNESVVIVTKRKDESQFRATAKLLVNYLLKNELTQVCTFSKIHPERFQCPGLRGAVTRMITMFTL
jgi:hypothetical protein